MPQTTLTAPPHWRASAPPPPPPRNGLAVIGFGLGLLGVICGTVPLFFIGTLVLGTFGLVLSIRGLQASNRHGAPHKNLGFCGVGLAGLALVLGLGGLLIVSSVFVAFNSLGETRPPGAAPQAASRPPTSETSVTTSPTPPMAAPSGPAVVSPMLAGNARPAVPADAGQPGQVSVVLNGPYAHHPAGGSIPVVIVNRTAHAVTDISVTVDARNGNGPLIGTASDHGVHPDTLGPDEMAISMVYFQPPLKDRSNLQIEATVEAREAEPDFGPFSKHDLKIVEVNNTGAAIVGRVQNQTQAQTKGPGSVFAVCFGRDGQALVARSGSTSSLGLQPGAFSSFSIDLHGDESRCPTFLVGASGYSF